MANYDSNYAIAQEISARIGTSPIPFDSVYSIALEIYHELGGEESQFDSVYSILLGILPLVEGGGAKQLMQEVTYAELKALRDNSQLVKGQQYRITDYVTTTYGVYHAQSAEHPFDIIVTADSENKLNENARAIKSASDYTPIHYHIDDNDGLGYGYDGAITIDGVKYYKWYTDEITPSVFTILTTEKVYDNEPDGEDGCGEYYLTTYPFAGEMNSDEELREEDYWGSEEMKSVVKTEWTGTMSAAIQVYDSENDVHKIYGRYSQGDTSGQYAWALAEQSVGGGSGRNAETIDDITYWDLDDWDDSYYLYTSSETPNIGDTATGDAGTFEITDYQTNIPNGGALVIGDAFDCNTEGYQTNSYFGNCKLESWEIKYCLDNDNNRFSWAKYLEDAISFKVLNGSEYVEDGKDYVLTDVKISDIYYGEAILDDFPQAKYVWQAEDALYYDYAITSTKCLGEGESVLYCESNGDSRGWANADSITYQPGTEGKGVIYYMKDEWNNQAGFDFKNIKFWDENDNIYYWFIGAEEYDYTLDGNAKNNIFVTNFGYGETIQALPLTYHRGAIDGYQDVAKDTAAMESHEDVFVDGNYRVYTVNGTGAYIVWETYYTPVNREVSVIINNQSDSSFTPRLNGNYILMGNGLSAIEPQSYGLFKGVYNETSQRWIVEYIPQAQTIAE